MTLIRDFYEMLIDIGDFLKHFLLLAMRLFWGYSFFKTGMGKVHNIESVIDYFSSLGIPFPEYQAHLAAWTEATCGFCLLIGFASRLVSLPLIILTIVALLTAHKQATFALLQNPQEFISQLPFNYLLTSLVVFCFGPGAISADGLLGRLFFRKKG